MVKALYLPASIALNKSLANEGLALNDLTKLIVHYYNHLRDCYRRWCKTKRPQAFLFW